MSGTLFSSVGTEPVLAAVAVGLLACGLLLVWVAVRGAPALTEAEAAEVETESAALAPEMVPVEGIPADVDSAREPEVVGHTAPEAETARHPE